MTHMSTLINDVTTLNCYVIIDSKKQCASWYLAAKIIIITVNKMANICVKAKNVLANELGLLK